MSLPRARKVRSITHPKISIDQIKHLLDTAK